MATYASRAGRIAPLRSQRQGGEAGAPDALSGMAALRLLWTRSGRHRRRRRGNPRIRNAAAVLTSNAVVTWHTNGKAGQ
jgi:hypothetical protein